MQLDPSLFDHWGGGIGVGEAASIFNVPLTGRDGPYLGSSLPGSFPVLKQIWTQQPDSGEHTPALILSGGEEPVPDPATWLFSPFLSHMAYLCEGTNLEEVKGPSASSHGGFSGDDSATDQSSQGSQPSTRPNLCEALT